MSRFVIRRVRSGPPDLNAQLPVSGTTVETAARPSPDDDCYYADLDQPLRYRPPADGSVNAGGHVDEDEDGPFLSVRTIALKPHHPGEEPHVGMRGFAFNLSYVIDALTVDAVAVVEVDDLDGGRAALGAQERGAEPPDVTTLVAAEDFTARLDQTLSLLAALAGEHARAAVLAPRRVDSAEHLATQRIPTYCVERDRLHYYTHDSLEGWVRRETTEPDELLYWIVNDIASEVAWHWAQRTPAFAAMSDQHAQRTLWLPYWHILMHALRPEWGSRVRKIMRAFAHRLD